MKRFYTTRCSIVIATVFVLISPFNLAQANTHHAKQLNNLLERNVLRVAMFEQDSPPFYSSYKPSENEQENDDFYYEPDNSILTADSDVVVGLDAELIKGFASKLGVYVKFIRTPELLDEVVDMVANGEADVGISKLSITFKRTTKVLFTKPYIKLRKALIVNRSKLEKQRGDKTKEQAIQNLTGKLGVIGGSSYVTYAHQRFDRTEENSNDLEIVEKKSWNDVVDAVASTDKVNENFIAGFRDEAEIKYLIKKNKKYAKDILTVVLKNDYDPKGIALHSDAYFLKFMLDSYIDSLGLELNANRVILEFPKVIKSITRYRGREDDDDACQLQGEAP